ncbi:hypothetical protein [Tepidimonas charontis]|nr:hypothetical protein [Tepidimonas charontis]
MRQSGKDELKAEGEAQLVDTLSGSDLSSVDLSGALDWLGEALGSLLSP